MLRRVLSILVSLVFLGSSLSGASAGEASVPLPQPSEPRPILQSAPPLSTQATWRASTLYPIAFQEFLQEVERSNLDLAAQRYNVSIAEAQLVVARVYPNPTFQLGYNGDVSHQN